MKGLKAWMAAGIVLALFTAGSVGVVLVGKSAFAAEGDKAPDFSLKDINGKTHKLSSFKGKVILLNWFASW